MPYQPNAEPPMFNHQAQTWLDTRELPAWGLLFEQRCGKTRVLLDTAGWLQAEGKVTGLLVVAPKEVTRTWENTEVPKHLNAPYEVYRWAGRPGKAATIRLTKVCKPEDRLKVLLINVEAFSGSSDTALKVAKHFLKQHKALLAVDESSVIKDKDSKRTQKVLGLAALAPYRRILTGTPVTQSPLDIFTQANFLDTRVFGTNYYSFRARYAEVEDVYLKGPDGKPRASGNKRIKAYRNLDELTEKLKSISTRVLRADCFDLPPKQYQQLDVELSDEAKRLYNLTAAKQVAKLLEENIVTPTLAISRVMALRQITSEFLLQHDEVTGVDSKIEVGEARVARAVRLVKELDGKIILWTVFKHTQQRLLTRLVEAGFDPVRSLTGDTEREDRATAAQDFQIDPAVKAIVVNQRVGQYGLDLSAADWVVYVEHDWSVERRLQSEDRAQHPLKKTGVGYIDLVAPDTIDDVIRDALQHNRTIGEVVAGLGWRGLFKEVPL
jgi:SNF2 family DNA or RNA helicase